MEEIKTGNYIRTEKGIIDKITSVFYDKDGQVDRFLTRNAAIYTEDDKIIKCHEDLLNLIEKGDILKIKEGNEVCYIGFEEETTTLSYHEIIESIRKKEIKLLEILTKEQFNKESYKVEE